MIVIQKEVTDEGEEIPYQQTDLECGSEVDGSNDRVFMMWPVTIGHKIDDESPFYEMTPQEMLKSQFEIVVALEGVTEETGNTIQVARVDKFKVFFCNLTHPLTRLAPPTCQTRSYGATTLRTAPP
jgi:hypothetical protein